MEEDTELVELETAPEAGVRGVTVARDRHGLYVAKAPKSLPVHQGDRLLSARVFFEGAPAEDVARLLEGAGSCKVSLRLQRRLPVTSGKGRQGKVARLSIPILTASKKPPPAPVLVSAALGDPVAVELALPKLPRLAKSRIIAESAATPTPTAAPEPKQPRATPTRLTVKEAAAGKTLAMEEPLAKTEVPGLAAEAPAPTGTHLPAVELAVPKVTVGPSLAGTAPPQAKEPALRLPQLEVVVPALPLPAVMPEPNATVSQPQIKLGEGDRASLVPKTKLLSFGTAPSEAEEGGAGTRGGFAGISIPSITIDVPSAAVELGAPKPELPRARSEEKPPRSESPPAAPALPPLVPSIDIAVPRVGLGLALPNAAARVEGDGGATAVPDVVARFAKGLQKLSLELEPMAPLPVVEIAAPARLAGDVPETKPPKFTSGRFGLGLTKIKTGGDEHPPASPSGPSPAVALDLALGTVGAAGVKLKVPKLSLAPFGIKDGDKGAGGRDAGAAMKLPRWAKRGLGRDEEGSAEPESHRLRVPQVGIALPAAGARRVPSLPKLPTMPELGGGVKLPKFGGSSPDIRAGGHPKTLKRGGSAESLSVGAAGRKTPESPGMARWKLRTGTAPGDGGAQPSAPRFAVPMVGFAVPGKQPEDRASRKIPKPTRVLKVPVLELAPPGMEETAALGRQARVKLPKFGTGSTSESREGRMRMGSVKKEKEDPHSHINGEAEGKARRRWWVPRVGFSPGVSPPESPKAGKTRFTGTELSGFEQQPMEVSPCFNLGGGRGEGAPKFQLPKLVLSPQPCSE